MWEKHRETSVLVHLLVCLFGIGAWVGTNGILIELPILVERLPERWNLASYLVIAIQIANVGPLIYMVGHLMFPKRIHEVPVAHLIIILAAVCCLLLVFLWNQTSEVGGVEHSTFLMVLLLFMAMANCTSSVVFLPFMSQLKVSYMTSFYIGQGLSSFVPSMVALGQGVGAMSCHNRTLINTTTEDKSANNSNYFMSAEYYPPRFPPRDFFGFLFVTMVVCGVSFIFLNHLPTCKRERVTEYDIDKAPIDNVQMAHDKNQVVVYHTNVKLDQAMGLNEDKKKCLSGENVSTRVKTCLVKYTQKPLLEFTALLIANGWINALENGVLPSIQSYAYLPYGNQPYHLALVFSNVADPMMCFLAFFLPTNSKRLVTILTILATIVSAYILVLASLSPAPFLIGQSGGAVIAVMSQVLATSFLTYCKLCIAAIFRVMGGKSLLWYGAVTQLGSLIGAMITFILVNVLNVFHAAPPCRLLS